MLGSSTADTASDPSFARDRRVKLEIGSLIFWLVFCGQGGHKDGMRLPLLWMVGLLSASSAAFAQRNSDCIFCQIVGGEREASVVYRGARVTAFLDHAPLNPGHALIVPNEHAETLAAVPPESAREMMIAAQKIGTAFAGAGLKSESVQLQMNSGAMVQRIPHALLHVWPRFKGDFRGTAGERLASDRPRAPRSELDGIALKLKTVLDLRDLYDEYYEERLALFPFEATSAGDDRYNDRLPNTISNEYRENLRRFYEKYLARLRAFVPEELSPVERTSFDTLRWECELGARQLDFATHLLPVNQFSSLPLQIARLAGGTSEQPFKTPRDYENWLKRLDGFARWCETALDNMREGIAKGCVLPRPLTEKVIPQLLKMASGPVEEHLFYSPIRNMPAGFSNEDGARLARAYAEIIREKIIPAYAKLHAFMLAEYLPASRATSGIGGIPNGAEFYELQIKTYTTAALTAEEIFQIGQNEVSRIRGEMERIQRQVGFDGSLREFFDHLRAKEELMPFSDPQEVIDRFNEINRKIQPSVDRLFTRSPKTVFEVRRTESFRERSAAAQYMAGTLDGTRPGIFYVPIPDVEKYSIIRDESLFLHEAIPGHHYQVSLQREDTRLPKFRRTLIYSAYAEGWALYCESLGKELGLYTDPYQYFGMLSAEMHRAIRLVVDTGIHAKGWTREQAIAYSLANEPASEASIISEIERYMAWPGQALSYKIGQLKISELRARAEKELGEKFDVRDFHDQVLETGCVPLGVLQEKIDRWIAASR
jgi:uncharacterized protein (DUF885 family)/diadenosine tetraphosphate (Ap4A) HIT family hydrolase